MKYKFTGETKEIYGITVQQIIATESFGIVTKGDIGGWIESESNLSGEAWVFGKARVFGEARVFGKARVSGEAWVSGEARVLGEARVSPLNLIGLIWIITITDNDIEIGCEFHSIDEWGNFTNHEINEMDSIALEFWNTYKTIIMSLAREHQNKVKS